MKRAAFLFCVALLAMTSSARSEVVATLTLDGLSFVSFSDLESVPLPAGSTLKLRFGRPDADGSVPFTIAPGDVSISPISLGGGQTLAYTIASAASGTMRRTDAGRKLEFTARVRAAVSGGASPGSREYTVRFTTEGATASDFRQTKQVSVRGSRVVEGVGYMQLVGAATNAESAYPGPGAAVYTVLSGRLDRMP